MKAVDGGKFYKEYLLKTSFIGDCCLFLHWSVSHFFFHISYCQVIFAHNQLWRWAITLLCVSCLINPTSTNTQPISYYLKALYPVLPLQTSLVCNVHKVWSHHLIISSCAWSFSFDWLENNFGGISQRHILSNWTKFHGKRVVVCVLVGEKKNRGLNCTTYLYHAHYFTPSQKKTKYLTNFCFV